MGFNPLINKHKFFQSHIEDMSEDVFSKHVGALAAKRMEQPKRLGVQNARYWNEITSQQYNFDRGKALH